MPSPLSRSVFADPNRKDSFSAQARARRWEEFMKRFPELADMRVVDLGGTPDFWRAVPVKPAHVTCINMEPESKPVPEEWITSLVGDATEPAHGSYDLAVSNSVIEHVGGHEKRAAFARVVHGAADRHWVQTPYRYFPIEPHWVFPGFQFLPTAVAMQVSRRWPYGRRSTASSAWADVVSVELLSAQDMRGYFPDSLLWRERFGGLTKSLVAVKS